MKHNLSRREFLQSTKAGVLVMTIAPKFLSDSSVTDQKKDSQELIDASVVWLAKAIRTKQVSSEEVVRAFLQRIEQVNPKINAVVQIHGEAALADARAADQQAQAKRWRGPLHGVPCTIKDSFETKGMISTAGLKGRAAFIPDTDATAVARLRAAGAIVLGKTNTPELTLAFETNNLVYGRTNNPYNLERTSGGSSGGAAAILAASGSPCDLGTDTGGSIRLPSHYCGIAGMKPTQGRIPRTGHIISFDGPHQSLTHVGPMARYVEDLAFLLPILTGPDGIDPSTVPLPLGDSKKVDLKKLRTAFLTDNGDVPATAEIAAVVKEAAKRIADLGGVVTEARPERIKEAYEMYVGILWADGGAWARRLLQKTGTQETLLEQRLSTFKAIPIGDYSALLERWDQFRSQMLRFWQNYDVLICPANAHAAIPHGTTYQGRNLAAYGYTMAFNLTGWPSVVVRCGTSAEGLPIGVQVVAPPWREDVSLAVAQHLQLTSGGWRRAQI
ncbi:MAG TPA: amidase [Pyrinomonadaceae bacterium]|nr:amidase [Pyrinomonadaceae bacterium]